MPLLLYINDHLQHLEWRVNKTGGIYQLTAEGLFGSVRIERFKGSGYTCWNILVFVNKAVETSLQYTSTFCGLIFQHKNSVHVELFSGEQVLLQRSQLMLLFPAMANMRMHMKKAGVYGFMAVHYARYLLTLPELKEPMLHLFSPWKLPIEFHVIPEKYLLLKRRNKKVNRGVLIPAHELIQLQLLFEQIQANPEAAVTVSLLARKAGMSKKKLETLFKFHYQKTIREVITDERLAKAKKLLRETNLTISEIADQTGYNNAAAFIKFFKKACNTTPLQYRITDKRN